MSNTPKFFTKQQKERLEEFRLRMLPLIFATDSTAQGFKYRFMYLALMIDRVIQTKEGLIINPNSMRQDTLDEEQLDSIKRIVLDVQFKAEQQAIRQGSGSFMSLEKVLTKDEAHLVLSVERAVRYRSLYALREKFNKGKSVVES